MFQGLLSENVKITLVKAAQTAATSAVAGDAVDMAADGGWQGVMFVGTFGTPAADNKLKAQQSSDNAVADAFADIEGSEIDPAGSTDETQIVDVLQPTERYVKPYATRGTSSTMGDIYAIQYRGRELPYNNVLAGTKAVKQVIQAPEGTA